MKSFLNPKLSFVNNHAVKQDQNLLSLYDTIKTTREAMLKSMCFNCAKKALHIDMRGKLLGLE